MQRYTVAFSNPSLESENDVNFKFQRFTDTETSFAARITVRQTGQLGFNIGAINRYKIREYGYAILYFDPENRVVGLQLTNDRESPGAIEIKQSDSNTYIRAKNFCDRFGIEYETMSRYDLKQDSETGFLYFVLAERQDESDDEEVKSSQESEKET